ncbi:MAG TPA: SDR family NAD(P)-dependent oxidoreductase [Bradyrhizobium sp.]|uniref:SDR family NAD(P)-dependent oxidoreductase n=1 Tax=Bradyrhizobium sp. TaxID=376 RepID=UPI002B47D547|nr:SDR family NAD(P)-dependent oxidoreductase [Bradyrhizobium sp.]HKO71691.1 SDR family NAD(P)-dependent oxidoreductase [Bradyrhizobium sp.]
MKADHLDRAVLITGGCGFIGCNLADALARRGEKVVAFDNLSRTGVRENAQWLKSRHGGQVSIVTGDVRDAISVIQAVRRAKAVLHLAAQVAVTGSLEDPIEDFEINARGTLNVLEAIRVHNHSAPMIFASTNKVYGRLVPDSGIKQVGRRHVPADMRLAQGVAENFPLDFYSPYGCSKGTADQYVRDYARVYGMNTAVLRMSCIYGPRQFGTEDQGWLAHFMLRSILGEPLTIFGDGLQVRDALHVSDAAAAWIAVLENIGSVRGRVFNLGGGTENAISLLELIDQIASMRGAAPSLSFDRWRPGDQPWYISRCEALKSAVGWQPQIPLRQGLQSLLEWLEGRFSPARSPVQLRL